MSTHPKNNSVKIFFSLVISYAKLKKNNNKKINKTYREPKPLENFKSVIATDAESDTSLMMTVTCLTLSIKSLPLIRVNVYGTLRGVREERVIEKRG